MRHTQRWRSLLSIVASVSVCSGCAGVGSSETTPVDPKSYRLVNSGLEWRRAPNDPVLEDLLPRYPEFFAVILDPSQTEEPDIRPIRADLEAHTDGRERYDALNAVAVAYFELNARAQAAVAPESSEVEAGSYLADSFRATKLLSIPWRAYREIPDPALRDAILDFFADIARGEKRESLTTAPRILRLVSTLERKESDAARLARIRALGAMLEAMQAAAAR